MGSDNELDRAGCRGPAEQPQEFELHPGREGIFGFVEEVQAWYPEPVLEESHVGLPMGPLKQGSVPEIFQRFRVGDRPFVQGFGEVAEDLGCKKRSPGLPAIPFERKVTVEIVLVGIVVVPHPLVFLPDVDAALPGNGRQQGGLPGSILPDKESNRPGKPDAVRLPEYLKIERIAVPLREPVMEQAEPGQYHTSTVSSAIFLSFRKNFHGLPRYVQE